MYHLTINTKINKRYRYKCDAIKKISPFFFHFFLIDITHFQHEIFYLNFLSKYLNFIPFLESSIFRVIFGMRERQRETFVNFPVSCVPTNRIFVHRAATSHYLGRFETRMEKIMFGISVAESAASCDRLYP